MSPVPPFLYSTANSIEAETIVASFGTVTPGNLIAP